MVDRFTDIVKTGGENVSSPRVEGVMAGHPDVERVAVVGLPDERWGEAVTAVVVRALGAQVTEEELIAHARTKLAGFEVPKRIVFVEDMPSTVGGKIMKYKLRQHLQGVGQGSTDARGLNPVHALPAFGGGGRRRPGSLRRRRGTLVA